MEVTESILQIWQNISDRLRGRANILEISGIKKKEISF